MAHSVQQVHMHIQSCSLHLQTLYPKRDGERGLTLVTNPTPIGTAVCHLVSACAEGYSSQIFCLCSKNSAVHICHSDQTGYNIDAHRIAMHGQVRNV